MIRAFGPILNEDARFIVVASGFGRLRQLREDLRPRFDTAVMTMEDLEKILAEYRVVLGYNALSRGGIIDFSRSITAGFAGRLQSGVSRPQVSGSPQLDRCRPATGTVPLGWVGLIAHQHQSTSFSVIQAWKLAHQVAEAGYPPRWVGRPKLARDRVSLPNSPTHSGAIRSLRTNPPLRCIWAKYACRGWPCGWNQG
jgi:hypothetical protein